MSNFFNVMPSIEIKKKLKQWKTFKKLFVEKWILTLCVLTEAYCTPISYFERTSVLFDPPNAYQQSPKTAQIVRRKARIEALRLLLRLRLPSPPVEDRTTSNLLHFLMSLPSLKAVIYVWSSDHVKTIQILLVMGWDHNLLCN